MFPPLFIYSVIAFVAISSKSLFGVVITSVLQSSGTFPVDKISKFATSFTSFCKYMFKYCIPFVNVNELYPDKKYTFGIESVVTDFIAAVNFSSAILIDSYVFESYVYNSLEDNTLYFSPFSMIIPSLPDSIPYLLAKSGLSVDVTASTVIFSFAFVYCLAKSKVVSSSLYPTK